jgi:glycosyltransferase involved in cell wall biosynthesis
MPLPLVTVAVPTVGRLDYLKEAVGSALAQAYPRVEVLVGDDGAHGELRAWCEAQAARDARLRYQRNARRLGLAGNWNALADAARGEFITIIGDDDRLLPDFVGKLTEAARAPDGRPACDVAFANHYLIDAGGARLAAESVECTRQYGRDLLPAGELADAARAVWRNSVPMSAALVRASVLRRLRFKEDLNTPELELFARLAEEGARFVFVPEYLAEYRTHARSATAAGLRSERLAERLLDIEVAPRAEPYKREFMSGLLVNAVSRCLEQGDRERARRLLRSGYYPAAHRGGGLRLRASVCVQGVCAALPAPLGRRAYQLARRLKTSLSL